MTCFPYCFTACCDGDRSSDPRESFWQETQDHLQYKRGLKRNSCSWGTTSYIDWVATLSVRRGHLTFCSPMGWWVIPITFFFLWKLKWNLSWTLCRRSGGLDNIVWKIPRSSYKWALVYIYSESSSRTRLPLTKAFSWFEVSLSLESGWFTGLCPLYFHTLLCNPSDNFWRSWNSFLIIYLICMLTWSTTMTLE